MLKRGKTEGYLLILPLARGKKKKKPKSETAAAIELARDLNSLGGVGSSLSIWNTERKKEEPPLGWKRGLSSPTKKGEARSSISKVERRRAPRGQKKNKFESIPLWSKN